MNIAILGYGGRGKNYAWISRSNPQKFKVTAVIDNSAEKLNAAKKFEKLSSEELFLSLDDFLSAPRDAEMIFICTQDKQHYEHAIKCLEAGYDILLEKPIAPTLKECLEIERVAKEAGRNVIVCHVLRYTAFYTKVKEILDSGALGKIISIEMQENVGYWHHAHSYVRGDWGNTAESTPMIMAKCCHDLDLAVYFANSACRELYSVGELNYFKKECAPNNSADRCVHCNLNDCPYDARKLYIERFKKLPFALKRSAWPMSRIVADNVPTLQKLNKALETGEFGRCVFRCDNDAVDYQVVQMLFENGIRATLTMSAFSIDPYRTIHIRGTLGELTGYSEKRKLVLSVYGKKTKQIKTKLSIYGHGGGDVGLMNSLQNPKTDISVSIESHIMALASEASRKQGGAVVDLIKFRNN